MTFYNFSCQKLESVGLSEIVIESFLDSDNFDWTMFYKKCKKETPRDTITLEGLQVNITNEVNAGF